MHEHCYIYTCIPGQFVDLFGIVWDCISQFLLMVVISPSCFAVMLNKNMFEYASPLGTGCRFLRSLTFIGGGILTWGWLRSYHKQMEMWRWPSSEATDGLWIPTRNLDGFGVLLNRLHRWTATMSGFFFIRRSNRWFQHQWGVPRFFFGDVFRYGRYGYGHCWSRAPLSWHSTSNKAIPPIDDVLICPTRWFLLVNVKPSHTPAKNKATKKSTNHRKSLLYTLIQWLISLINVIIWILSGWWFQTFFIFHNIWVVILPIDFHIFQDG